MDNYYDIAVIGGGPGGYEAAIRSSQLGAKTVIIEMDNYGGTCLNYGCIPSKALISAAETYSKLVESNSLFNIKSIDFEYKNIITHKNEIVKYLRENVKKHLRSNKVTLINGTAQFISRNKLSIYDNNNKSYTINSDKIIIATGSKVSIPSFIKKTRNIIDSDDFFKINDLPKEITILGAGYIGCEIACLLAAFGVKVTLIEQLSKILSHLDNDLIKVVKDYMISKLNIKIYENTTLNNVTLNRDKVKINTNKQKFNTEMLLVATGRVPKLDLLKIDNINLKLKNKFIEIDEYNQTSEANIYAIGDITDNMQLAHSASSQGIYAAEHSCGVNNNKNETVIPAVIFTIPEIGYVGLTEKQAKNQGIECKIYKYYFKNLSKSIITGDTLGFAKWIVEKNTNQIIGASVVGKNATDLISEATIAVREELTINEIKKTVHAHPTLSEIWYEAVKHL